MDPHLDKLLFSNPKSGEKGPPQFVWFSFKILVDVKLYWSQSTESFMVTTIDFTLGRCEPAGDESFPIPLQLSSLYKKAQLYFYSKD